MRRAAIVLALSAAAAFAEDGGLVDVVVVNGMTAPEPLSDWSGAPETGAAVVEAAGCLSCHQDGALAEAAAGKSFARLRLALVEPSILLGETEMPAYYAVGLYGEAPDDQVGRTRLSADEIEQVLAYLETLGAVREGTEK